MNSKAIIFAVIILLASPELIVGDDSRDFKLNSYVHLEDFALALPDTHIIQTFWTIPSERHLSIHELRLSPVDYNSDLGHIIIRYAEDFGDVVNFSWEDMSSVGHLLTPQTEEFGAGKIIVWIDEIENNKLIKSVYEDRHVQIMVLGKNSYELLKFMLEESKPF